MVWLQVGGGGAGAAGSTGSTVGGVGVGAGAHAVPGGQFRFGVGPGWMSGVESPQGGSMPPASESDAGAVALVLVVVESVVVAGLVLVVVESVLGVDVWVGSVVVVVLGCSCCANVAAWKATTRATAARTWNRRIMRPHERLRFMDRLLFY
jgi:hypothetical protein